MSPNVTIICLKTNVIHRETINYWKKKREKKRGIEIILSHTNDYRSYRGGGGGELEQIVRKCRINDYVNRFTDEP